MLTTVPSKMDAGPSTEELGALDILVYRVSCITYIQLVSWEAHGLALR